MTPNLSSPIPFVEVAVDCIIGLAVGVLGLVLTITGKIKVTGSSESRGPLVRLAGVLLLLALPLYLGTMMAIGFNEGLQAAANNANGQVNQQQLQQKILSDFWWLWIAFYGGSVVLALILMFSSIKPIGARSSRRRRDDDDNRDDDRPRRFEDDREDDRRDRRYEGER